MLRLALLALVGATAALRVAPLRAASGSAAGAIRMGAAVGDKLPSSVLSTCGVSGKKAVIFFYGAVFFLDAHHKRQGQRRCGDTHHNGGEHKYVRKRI